MAAQQKQEAAAAARQEKMAQAQQAKAQVHLSQNPVVQSTIQQ
jgi:hypothetical protein